MPIPLLIVADEAWAEVQVKVALAPAAIVVGEAAKVTVGGVGTGVATEPAQPVNKPVVKPKVMHSNRREVQGQSLFMSCIRVLKRRPEVASLVYFSRNLRILSRCLRVGSSLQGHFVAQTRLAKVSKLTKCGRMGGCCPASDRRCATSTLRYLIYVQAGTRTRTFEYFVRSIPLVIP